MDPVLSVFLRGMNYQPTSTNRLQLADEVKVWQYVMFDQFRKISTLRGLQYNTPEEQADEESCEIQSKLIAVVHTNIARVMRTNGNLVKEKELKNSLLDIESKVLNATRKVIHVNLTVLDTLEILREVFENIENCYKLLPSQHANIYVSMLRDCYEGISNMLLSISNQTKEKAEVQQISEIELD